MKSINSYVLGTVISIMLVGCVMADEASFELPDSSEIVLDEELYQAPLAGQVEEEVYSVASLDDSAAAIDNDGDFGTEACWVTLVYCDDPRTPEENDFVCRQSGCSLWQYIAHCTALVDQYC